MKVFKFSLNHILVHESEQVQFCSSVFIIYIILLAVGVALRATPTPSWWGTSRPPASSFIYPACASGVPVIVVSLCPGRHLYSPCPGRDLCPGVPVCNFSLRFPVVIYIPCVPVVICVPVSRYVISSVDKHDVSRQTTS